MRPMVFGATMVCLGGMALAGCRAAAPAQPVATAQGTAEGQAASATIGADGGTLSSADGRLALVVPAGALSADTTVTIQPITNLAHGGLGAAYRLAPEGQVFARPVTLRFTYAAADLAGTTAELLGVASQTADGFWAWTSGPVLDSAGKSVSVEASHFSDWSLVKGLQLRPGQANVKSGGTLELRVANCYLPPGDATTTFILGYACDHSQDDLAPVTAAVTAWLVNGVEGGNATVGQVDGSDLGPGTYRAPKTKPTPNVVTVSAQTNTKYYGKLLLLSNVTIDNAPKRQLVATHASSEPLGENHGVSWTGGAGIDTFWLTVIDDGSVGDYGVGGSDGALPSWMGLQNTDTKGDSLVVTGPCMSQLPPEPTGGFEVMTVNRVDYTLEPRVSFRFDGVRHVPGVKIGDTPCLTYALNYPAEDRPESVQFPVSTDEWNQSATHGVTVSSADGYWALTISAMDGGT